MCLLTTEYTKGTEKDNRVLVRLFRVVRVFRGSNDLPACDSNLRPRALSLSVFSWQENEAKQGLP